MAQTTDGEPPQEENLGAAAQLLAEATAALTAALKREGTAVMPEVRSVVATSLRDAAQGLSDISAKMGGPTAHSRRSRPSKVDRTRADILAGAATVFEARGYEGASVGEIAAVSGYTKGALYAHFPSKKELFLEVATSVLQPLPEHLCTSGLMDLPPGPPRIAAITELIQQAATKPGGLLGVEIMTFAIRHPESGEVLGALYDDAVKSFAHHLAVVRAQAQDPGITADDVVLTDEDFARVITVLGLLNLTSLYTAIVGPQLPLAELAARQIDALLS